MWRGGGLGTGEIKMEKEKCWYNLNIIMALPTLLKSVSQFSIILWSPVKQTSPHSPPKPPPPTFTQDPVQNPTFARPPLTHWFTTKFSGFSLANPFSIPCPSIHLGGKCLYTVEGTAPWLTPTQPRKPNMRRQYHVRVSRTRKLERG